MADEQYYISFIESVWQGTLSATPSQINSEVISTTETVFLEIQRCSRAMTFVDILYEVFYTATSFTGVIGNIKRLGRNPDLIGDWAEAIRGNLLYRACVVTAAASWKNVMYMALNGIWRRPDAEIVQHLKDNPHLGVTGDREIQEFLTKMRGLLPER